VATKGKVRVGNQVLAIFRQTKNEKVRRILRRTRMRGNQAGPEVNQEQEEVVKKIFAYVWVTPNIQMKKINILAKPWRKR
jgi:hypothetical protein